MIRNLLIILALVLVFVSAQGVSDEGGHKVHVATDFQTVSHDASQRKLPVLVFFAGQSCEYCEMLEDDHLAHMAHSNSYKDKVIIRKVFVDDYEDIRDFQGNEISTGKFSERFSIRVTPTLVLLDASGKPLGKKMLGYNRSDFYSFYLDEAIENARKMIQ